MRICQTIFFLITVFLCSAQLPQYHARVFDARNGLSANTIIDIFKDKEDLLWVIYNYSNTIERFDGRTVDKFTFSETVVHYLNDEKNNTWVIGSSTINKLSEPGGRFQKINFDTSGMNKLIRIFQPPGKAVTLLSLKGFYEWDEKQQIFNRVKKPFVTPGQRSGPVFFDTCGNTIFFPGRQLYAYDYVTEKIDSIPAPNLFSVYAFTPTLAIYVRFDGVAFWADFANKKITPLDAAKYFPGEKIVHFRVLGVSPLTSNRFLVLTTAGLMQYDMNIDRFTRLGIYADGTPFEFENVLSRLFIDKNGTAWAHAETIVAAFSPISKTLGLLRNKEQEPEKKWYNTVFAFAKDNQDRLWIATGFGFARMDLSTGAMEVFHPVDDATDQLSHESVRGILFDGKYVILAPTDKGIWLYDPATKKYRRPGYANDTVKRLSEHDFYDMIYTLQNGDHIFPGRDRLYIMNGKTYELRILSMPGNNINYNVAFQDSKRRIWIGTSSTVFCLDENYNVQFQVRSTVPGVFCMYETNPDIIYLGTATGLLKMKFNGDQTVAEPISNLLGNTPVTGIFRDTRNHFWFTTTNGLYQSDAALAAFRKFDYADNIQSLLYSGNSFIRTGSGLVFIGGKHGINYFVPEDFSLNDFPLDVKIKSVYTTNNDTLSPGQFNNLSYAYNKGKLSFNVSAPYYFNAEKVEFRYRLEGLQDDWESNGNNHIISFAALPEGKYKLTIAASTTGKIWYETKQPVIFTIYPPFWKRWWFILIMGLLFSTALILLQKRREKFLREKEEDKLHKQQLVAENLQYKLEANQAQLEVLETERKAATAKLQSMRLQMNPHFLFNALNSIQQMIMTGKEENATLYLSKFSKLLRMVLTHSDREIVSLREETEMLRLYIELESLRFEDTFMYNIHIDPTIDTDDSKLPTLLIQPFVENAIWHGLLHKEGQRRLDINFTTNDKEDLVCTIEDNGIGRESAKQYAKRSSQSNSHTGKGVSVADERLKIFNQHNGDSSSLNIQDLKDESGRSKGTKVIITLPEF